MSKLESFAEGMRAYHSGDYAAAARLLGELVQRPGTPGQMARYYCGMAHRALGIECISAGDYARAGRHFRRAVALIGRRAELAEYLLVIYAHTGEPERCMGEAEVLARAHPGAAGARVLQARAQWRAGRRQDAVMTLTRALRELGDRAELHLNLGLFYAAEEGFDLAREHLLKAVECDCSSADAFRYLGWVESARGAFAEAVVAFQRALSLDPGDLLAMYHLSLAAEAARRAGAALTVNLPQPAPRASASALDRLAEYVAAEPDFVEALLALPASEADGQLFGMLLSVLRTALSAHEDYADLHCLTGMTLRRLGRRELARERLRRAVEINPGYVRALLELAELEAELGADTRAVACLRRALSAGADYPDVHVRLGELLVRMGLTELAREHYGRALELNDRYDRAAAGLAALAA